MNDESRKFFETVRDYLLIYMAKQRVMSSEHCRKPEKNSNKGISEPF